MPRESFRSFSLTNTTVLSGLTPRQNLLKMANARLQDAQVFRMSKVIRLCRSSERSHGNPQQRKRSCLCRCNKSFGKAQHLKTHMLTHREEKIHNCSVCKKTFGRVAHLKIHMLTRSKERPYDCVQCNKSFGQAAHLKTHMLTHSGVKAHTYSECKKAFSEAGSLRMHMITHTGEKVHKCAECGGSFGRAGNLKSHMYSPTVKRRHTSAHNAIMHVQKQEILEDT